MRIWLILGALNGLLGVMAGAFGAHGLAGRLDAGRLATYATAVDYHLWHALALLAVAALERQTGGPALTIAGIAFTAGILLFSGTLYVTALTGSHAIAAAAPIGGAALLAGWAALVWAGLVP